MTSFPITVEGYLRQQRRWLRNVATHGRRFGAFSEMLVSLRTSVIGMTMLLMPLFGLLLTPWFLVMWIVLASHSLFARLRYLYFAEAVLDRPVRPIDGFWQAPLMFLDFVAWTQPLVDYLWLTRSWRW